jgi:DNA topoisomerase-1
VEEGEERWTDLLNGFYDHFEEELVVAGREMEDIKRMEHATDEICDKCGSPLLLKWGKFGSFYSCSNFSRLKPMTVGSGAWKKDSKAVVKKITKALHFPMTVKAKVGHVTEFSQEVADAGEMAAAIELAQGAGKKVTVEQVSCDFTKENYAAKPDLSAPGAEDVPEEEFCDNCGRVMVLRTGQWGPFMRCPGYSEDPPCKTIRKLTQKVQQKPPVVLDEMCPKCGKPLLQRDGQYGEFIACSGYPKCKYVKQELLEVPCPKCGGDVAVRKTRRGDTFYGCVNYPKCDFSSNQKMVNQVCPKCESAYLLELSNAKGTFLVCPNNRTELPKRRAKKGAAEAGPMPPECSYKKKVGPLAGAVVPVLEMPDPEKTRAVVESVA